MILWILYSLLLMFIFIFMNMKHPLAMGLILLIQTTMICLTTGLISKNFGFSYILFLVFLGGMLVLFIYVTSLASNEMFSFSVKLTLFSLLMFMLMMIINWTIDSSMFPLMNLENKLTSALPTYMTENSLSVNKLYNYPTNLITILLMNYLLITLIAVAKITKLSKGLLRHMFN